MKITFRPNPQGIKLLKQQLNQKLAPLNRDLNAAIARRRDETDAQMETILAGIVRRHRIPLKDVDIKRFSKIRPTTK